MEQEVKARRVCVCLFKSNFHIKQAGRGATSKLLHKNILLRQIENDLDPFKLSSPPITRSVFTLPGPDKDGFQVQF